MYGYLFERSPMRLSHTGKYRIVLELVCFVAW